MINVIFTIVSIFIVPLISLLIFDKINKIDFRIDTRQLGLYAIFTVSILFLGNIIKTALQVLTNAEISFGSLFYQIAAIALSLVAPFLLSFVMNNFSVEIKRNEEDK